MFQSDFDYGTNEYAKQYADFFVGAVRLVKLVNGETLVGFVDSELYAKKTCIDFPYKLVQVETSAFEMIEYTPSLKLKTITIDNDKILFTTILSEELEAYYINYIKENMFSSLYGTRTTMNGEVVSVTKEEADLDGQANVPVDSSGSYH